MRAAVLVIDIQKYILELKPWREKETLEVVSSIISEARLRGVEVISVQHDGEPGGPMEPGAPGWEIADQIKPLEGEKVIRKSFNSAFRKTGLEAYLREKSLDSLILMGMQTEYCIDTSIRVAFEKGFRVILPEGSNTTFDNPLFSAEQIVEYHNGHIFDGRFAEIRPLDRAFDHLED